MLRHFCTYFDQHYLVRGLTLYCSLARHSPSFVLWVLCLDDASYDTVVELELSNLRPIRLTDLEDHDPGLITAKSNRSAIEYYFTLTPAWPLALLRCHSDIDVITYVDADLLFFSSPEPILEELATDAVLIIEHRFPEHQRHFEIAGIFNVGFLSFRNDERGLARLEEWREQCIEWCHDRAEDGKFADQKYLDGWPAFPGVRIVRHKGAGLAPWNWMSQEILFDGDSVSVDGQPLIFFHFHGLKILNRWLFRASEGYGEMPRPLRRRIYGRYLRELSQTAGWLQSEIPTAPVPRSDDGRRQKHSFRDMLYWLRSGQLYTRLGLLRVRFSTS